MKKCFLYFLLLVFCQKSFCQPNKGKVVDIVIHRVELGETVVMISKKYLVNPTAIYGANRFIIDGINEGMVLQIPVVRKEGQLYATVQYPDDDLDQEIPTTAIAKNTEKKDPEIIKEEPIAEVEKTIELEEPIEKPIIKEEPIAVVEKPIVKEEPVTVVEKPIIKEEPVVILDKPIVKEEPVVVLDKPIVKEEPIASNTTTRGPRSEASKMMVTKIERDIDTDYTILKNETLYSISLKYDVSMEEIMAFNQDVLKDGVKAGLVIKIPANKKIINWDAATVTTTDSNTSESNNKVIEDKPVVLETKTIVEPKTVATSTNSALLGAGDKIVNGNIIHKVEAKETLYSLSKKYNTTVEIITANNENVKKSGLGLGFIIKIPVSKTGESPATTGAVAELDKKIEKFVAPVRQLDETDIIHKVVAKETLFSLAAKYKVSVYDIRSNNQNVMTNGLVVGQTIRIPAPKTELKVESKAEPSSSKIDGQVAENKIVKEKTPDDETFIVGDIITTVQPSETIESIAKKYDVTPEEIIKNNGTLLKDGKIKPGQVIKVPAKQNGAIEFSPDTFD